MPEDISFSFDAGDPQDQAWIERILAYKRSRASGVPIELVRRVAKTKVGKEFVLPLARLMRSDQPYSARELASMLGPSWGTRKVVSKLNVLGKPEARYGARIFERPSDGHYSLTVQMKDALMEIAKPELDGRAYLGRASAGSVQFIIELFESKEHPGHYHYATYSSDQSFVEESRRPARVKEEKGYSIWTLLKNYLPNHYGILLKEVEWQEVDPVELPLSGARAKQGA